MISLQLGLQFCLRIDLDMLEWSHEDGNLAQVHH